MRYPNDFLFREPWRTPVLLFLTCITIYAAFPPTTVGDVIPATLFPVTILREGNLTFDEYAQSDEKLPFWFTRINGHIVSSYPLIPGLLNVPVYTLSAIRLLPYDMYEERFRLTAITTIFIAAASVILLYGCARALTLSREAAAFTALVYGFCTSVWSSVSRALWQHGPSLLFMNAAVLLLLRRTRWSAPGAGLLLGFAVWNRPTNIVFALAISFFMAWKRPRELLAFLFPAACIGLLFALYSITYYGSVFALGQGQPWSDFSGTSVGMNFLGLLISPSRGLFVYSPFFIISIAAFLLVARRRSYRDEEALLLLLGVSCIPFLIIYAKWGMWWGGHVYGYRIITEIVAPLMLLFAWFIRHITMRAWMQGILTTLLFCSFVAQYLGVVRSPFCETRTEKATVFYHPEHLWYLHESQLLRCASRLYDPITPYRERTKSGSGSSFGSL